MIDKTELKSRLRLFALPAGTDHREIDALRDNPVADITDDGNRMLYLASSDEFFSLYCNGTTIVNAHACKAVTDNALQFLSRRPLTDLVLAGRFSKGALRAVRESAQNLGVALEIVETPEPRLFTAEVIDGTPAAFEPSAGFASESEALAACLAPGLGVRGAVHWTQLWKTEASLLPDKEQSFGKFPHILAVGLQQRLPPLVDEVILLDYASGKNRNIIDSFPEGWYRDPDDIEPVEKIFAESSLRNHLLKILVGSSYYACINWHGRCPPKPCNASVLKHAEYLDLQ